jgi:hypothetical protein
MVGRDRRRRSWLACVDDDEASALGCAKGVPAYGVNRTERILEARHADAIRMGAVVNAIELETWVNVGGAVTTHPNVKMLIVDGETPCGAREKHLAEASRRCRIVYVGDLEQENLVIIGTKGYIGAIALYDDFASTFGQRQLAHDHRRRAIAGASTKIDDRQTSTARSVGDIKQLAMSEESVDIAR